MKFEGVMKVIGLKLELDEEETDMFRKMLVHYISVADEAGDGGGMMPDFEEIKFAKTLRNRMSIDLDLQQRPNWRE